MSQGTWPPLRPNTPSMKFSPFNSPSQIPIAIATCNSQVLKLPPFSTIATTKRKHSFQPPKPPKPPLPQPCGVYIRFWFQRQIVTTAIFSTCKGNGDTSPRVGSTLTHHGSQDVLLHHLETCPTWQHLPQRNTWPKNVWRPEINP